MIADRIVESVTKRQVKYVTPVAPATAEGAVGDVYEQIAEELRIVVPPALLHSPSPPMLAAHWMLMREPLIAAGAADRGTKEAVAAVVSVANTCPYCVDVHSTGMYELSTEHDAEAIAQDQADDVDDPEVRDIVAWARTAHLSGEADAPAPFPESQRAEIVGVVVSFHYVARMVNVFLPGYLVPPRLSDHGRRRFKHHASRLLAPGLRRNPSSGRSVPLLPDAELPPDAAWAAGDPAVAGAIARSYAAFDEAGVRSVPAPVRELVLRRLETWEGEETGLSQQWCDDLIAELSPEDQPAGRLALLTTLASYQVDDDVIEDFQEREADDARLVETVAWASYVAARRVGARHLPPARGR